jgi:hypothetical protein
MILTKKLPTVPKIPDTATQSYLNNVKAVFDSTIIDINAWMSLINNNTGVIVKLPDSYLLVGNSLGVGNGVPMSGEASMVDTGAVTLSASAVVNKKISAYSPASGDISGADSILTAINKLGYDKHSPVTLGTPADGLSLTDQVLSCNLSGYLTTGDLDGCVLLAGRSGGQTIWGNTYDPTMPEATNLLLRAAVHKTGASPIDVEYGVRIRSDGLPTTGPNNGSITLAAIPTTDIIVHYLPVTEGNDGDLLFNNAGAWDWIGRAYVKVGSASNADNATAWLGFTSIDSNTLVASGEGSVILGVKVDGATITASESGLSAQAVTTMHPGTVNTLPGDATQYFDGTGNWSIPAGGGASTPAFAFNSDTARYARMAENANSTNKWKGMSVLSDMQMILTTQIFN